MNYFIDPLREIKEYNGIIEAVENYSLPVSLAGPADSQKAHISFSICRHTGLKGIYITYNEMQARKAFEDFSFLFGDEVVFFPSREIMLHDVEAKSYDAVYQRIKALDRILEGSFSMIVTSAEACVQRLVKKDYFRRCILRYSVGGRLKIDEFTQSMISNGYERMSIVEGKGQFAVRGGIIDVFPVDSDYAVRMELFDDEIDSLRRFDVQSQRSVDKLEEIRILPARDVIYPVSQRSAIVKRIRTDLEEYTKKAGNKSNSEHIEKLKSKINSDIDRLESDYYFPGMDRYIPYILEQYSDLADYAGNTLLFMDELSRIKQRADNIMLEYHESFKGMMEKSQILPGSIGLYLNSYELLNMSEKSKTVYMSSILTESERLKAGKVFTVPCKSMGSYQGHIDLLIDDISHWKANKCRIIVLSGTRGRGERLVESLGERGIESVYSDTVSFEPAPGQVVVTRGSLHRGFEYPSIGYVIISDKEVFGQERRSARRGGKKEGRKISLFTDLNVGDYVVHQAHGIGQYVCIEKLSVDNVKRDYIKIRYQDGDYLYIPTSQMDLIQKYIGPDGKTPKLSKLGGSDWYKTKKKVKESLKQLAEELIKLYAQRQALKGFPFSRDTVWQKQFEELFPYEETEDQLKCIEEIKKDMESDTPMDRLLCGDVGYGKTEVAIRALFKAVMDGKQVAYLVPTTILAQQHYDNFRERMKDFPVKVDVISRFRSPAEQKRILKDVKLGNVDVLIGTHRLLQKDIVFKDLGLLIVDEEQRFGVGHKERIKNLKPNVDVLTLTATPIPRTLHMSLVGIRDVSTLEDPPEERYPVQTYVMEYNDDVVRDAILREVGRGGQVFYLYNRVRSIQIKASEIQAMVPEARIAIAHGQMDEKQLEDVMYGFINGESDILVCTTIIESGLDMPNVNTIIVEDADRMGLAQLYQLRGRVGRSNKLAYAYITYKKDKMLSEIAEKRLQAIKEFTEFGSGFKIAMRDLEIRGAGNLLGPEQHGHMETVGYDMYCRLLDEAVKELKGEAFVEDEAEIAIDINVSAYIGDEYINSENQKIEMYKKIAAIQDETDVMDVEDELVDRYGDIPKPVGNLIAVAYIKTLARACGFVSIQEKNDTVIFQYKAGIQVNLQALSSLMDKYRRRLLFTASSAPYISFRTTGVGRDSLLDNIKILLQDIKNLQKG